METKHTPGPWHVGENGNQSTIVYDVKGWGVASATTYHGKTGRDVMIANARLIAAAPELLAALEAVKQAQRDGTYEKAFAQVDAALARAKE